MVYVLYYCEAAIVPQKTKKFSKMKKANTVYSKADIESGAELIAIGKGKQVWNIDRDLYAQCETLAKRYLTKDIKAMEQFMAEVESCSKKPISYGALKGSGFFYHAGEIRSPQWVQKQWAELYCMRARRARLNNVALVTALKGNI